MSKELFLTNLQKDEVQKDEFTRFKYLTFKLLGSEAPSKEKLVSNLSITNTQRDILSDFLNISSLPGDSRDTDIVLVT